MSVKFQDVMDVLEAQYPLALAESWDQVGLHFGHPDAAVQKVLVSLDVRPEVVEEAKALGVDTLIVHHPPIFSPIQRFDLSDVEIRMYAELIKAEMNVYAMHTNFDIAWDGMNDWLAQALNLEHIESLGGLTDTGQPQLGRLGQLPEALSREALLAHVKNSFNLGQLFFIEKEPQASYQKIAVIGGSGASLQKLIQASGADAFITGDITYHKGHDAYESGVLTIDAGHYIEHIFVEGMSQKLDQLAQEQQWHLTIYPSQVSTNPFQFA